MPFTGDWKILVSLGISIVLLAICMILSAHSAVLAARKDVDGAHKYSTISAVVAALAGFVILIVFVLYGLEEKRAEIVRYVGSRLATYGQAVPAQ